MRVWEEEHEWKISLLEILSQPGLHVRCVSDLLKVPNDNNQVEAIYGTNGSSTE